MWNNLVNSESYVTISLKLSHLHFIDRHLEYEINCLDWDIDIKHDQTSWHNNNLMKTSQFHHKCSLHDHLSSSTSVCIWSVNSICKQCWGADSHRSWCECRLLSFNTLNREKMSDCKVIILNSMKIILFSLFDSFCEIWDHENEDI